MRLEARNVSWKAGGIAIVEGISLAVEPENFWASSARTVRENPP